MHNKYLLPNEKSRLPDNGHIKAYVDKWVPTPKTEYQTWQKSIRCCNPVGVYSLQENNASIFTIYIQTIMREKSHTLELDLLQWNP